MRCTPPVYGLPFTHPGVESIDISEAGAAFGLTHFELNHDVFTANPVMLEDMRQLLQNGTRPPEKRMPALERRDGFWYYRQSGTGARATAVR